MAGIVSICSAMLFSAAVVRIGPGYRIPFRMEWWVLTEGVAISIGLCITASTYCLIKRIDRPETWRVTLLWVYWMADLAVNTADRELWHPHRSPVEGLANQATFRMLASINHWEHAVVVIVWIWFGWRTIPTDSDCRLTR